MRLLRVGGDDRFSLVEFTGQDIPPYAILSHTRGPDHEEVTFQDIINGTGQHKAGYNKLAFCSTQAAKDGLGHFWVDTCCINKSSSAELTESINSMFQWYENALVCYVTLQDLDSTARLAAALPRCRWFTRGWTLQELLVPNEIRFYDRTWTCIGSKKTLIPLLSAITNIRRRYLPTGLWLRLQWLPRCHGLRIEKQNARKIGHIRFLAYSM